VSPIMANNHLIIVCLYALSVSIKWPPLYRSNRQFIASFVN
jgi:hypothetical protein